MPNNKLIIFSAPSGAGKTTIAREVIKKLTNLEFSISACTRPKREKEVSGVDYYFLTVEEFKEKIEKNEFIEWEEVYTNSFYGTLKSEINRIWDKGNCVVFDVDVIGGLNIKSMYDALAIFIMPPSIDVLETRLKKRNTETEASLKKRLDKARYEISFASQFDKIITNDDLNSAVEQTIDTINNYLKS